MAGGRSNGEPGDASRLVWDLPLRLTHWVLALTVTGAWATHYAGSRWFGWHRGLGYATLVLVAFRIAWGFVGTRHARFAGFLRGPRVVLDYLRSRPLPATAGHNPLGALSVVAMLASLLLQASTGLCANDEISSAGPFYGWLTPAASNRISALHQANAKVLLALVIAPIATELPEKFNSVLWIRQRKDTLALGNITGAMVFQSTFPVSIGLVFTSWQLTGDALVAGLLALVSGTVFYTTLRVRHTLTWWSLGGAGSVYFIYLVYVFAIAD